MSLTIFSYMHVLCRRADLVKKEHSSWYDHPHILCICSKALQSDDRLLCDIEISGKTQNYHLESVCNFRVTRVYLILPCKQHNWTSGTYSIEMIINQLVKHNIAVAPSLKAKTQKQAKKGAKKITTFDSWYIFLGSKLCTTLLSGCTNAENDIWSCRSRALKKTNFFYRLSCVLMVWH